MKTAFKRDIISVVCALILSTLTTFVLYDAHVHSKRSTERLQTSTPQACRGTVIRGPRGEVYRGYVVMLLDAYGVEWQMKVDLSHRLAVFCEIQK